MKTSRNLLKSLSAAALILFVSSSMMSCNKGTSCPAYGSKHYKKGRYHSAVMVQKTTERFVA